MYSHMSFRTEYLTTELQEPWALFSRELAALITPTNIPYLFDLRFGDRPFASIEIKQRANNAVFTDKFIMFSSMNGSRVIGITLWHTNRTLQNSTESVLFNRTFTHDVWNFIQRNLTRDFTVNFDHTRENDLLNVITQRGNRANESHSTIQTFQFQKRDHDIIVKLTNNRNSSMATDDDGSLAVRGDPRVAYYRIKIEEVDENPDILTIRIGRKPNAGDFPRHEDDTMVLNDGTSQRTVLVFTRIYRQYDFTEFDSIESLADRVIAFFKNEASTDRNGMAGLPVDQISDPSGTARMACQMTAIGRLVDLVEKICDQKLRLNSRCELNNRYERHENML